MEKINLENKILEALKRGEVKPISKWRFTLHEFILFFLMFTSVVSLTISFGALFFIIDNVDTNALQFIKENIFWFYFRFIPFFWILISGLALYFSKKIWDKTKSGYKYNGKYIVGVLVILGCIGGLVLHLFMDAGRSFDNAAGKFMPLHKSFENREDEVWLKKHEGHILGVINKVDIDNFLVKERGGDLEKVFIEKDFPDMDFVATGTFVKILGYEEGDKFVACSVLPDRPRKNFGKFFENDLNKNIKIRNIFLNPKCNSLFESNKNFPPKRMQ